MAPMNSRADGIDFVCDYCGKTFVIPFRYYEGEFDHPPNVPLCPACKERVDSEEYPL